MNNEKKDICEKIRSMHPGKVINFQIPLYRLNEIYITGRGVVHTIEMDMKKEENRAFYSNYDIRRSIWSRILEDIENTINKE